MVEGGGLQNQREHHIILTIKVWSDTPNPRFGKLFLIRDVYNFDESANSMYMY